MAIVTMTPAIFIIIRLKRDVFYEDGTPIEKFCQFVQDEDLAPKGVCIKPYYYEAAFDFEVAEDIGQWFHEQNIEY